MNKSKIISLSITGASVIIGLIILIQVLPYMNIRNCEISQEMNLTNFTVVVVNNGDQMAKFPKMEFKLYKGSIFIGNGTINEFTIPPHTTVKKQINFDMRAKITELPTILSANTTKVYGKVYIKILWGLEIPIKYDIESDKSGSRVHVMGREIVVD